MTTKYSVKKCNTFGFAQSLKYAVTLFNNLNENNVIFVHDGMNKSETEKIVRKLSASIPSFTECNSIENITVPTNRKAVLFVELGYTTNKKIKVPIEYDDREIVEQFEHQYACNEFKNALLSSLENENLLNEQKFSNEFIVYITDMYPHLRDYKLKSIILNILNFNNVNTISLEQSYPFEYNEEIVPSVKQSTIFSDIEVSVDVGDKNTSTSMYKPDKDALKKAALGKTTQLDAFSENKFAIIHTKKKAGIENKIRNQNHDVLDTLAVNGVMKSPDTKKPLSVYKLMRKLEMFDSFDIIFIHPSYEVRCMNAEYPCEQIIPAYKINEGEILAVVYRYIVVYFFGYCSIFTDSMLEWRYYI